MLDGVERRGFWIKEAVSITGLSRETLRKYARDYPDDLPSCPMGNARLILIGDRDELFSAVRKVSERIGREKKSANSASPARAASE